MLSWNLRYATGWQKIKTHLKIIIRNDSFMKRLLQDLMTNIGLKPDLSQRKAL